MRGKQAETEHALRCKAAQVQIGQNGLQHDYQEKIVTIGNKSSIYGHYILAFLPLKCAETTSYELLIYNTKMWNLTSLVGTRWQFCLL